MEQKHLIPVMTVYMRHINWLLLSSLQKVFWRYWKFCSAIESC